MTRLDEIEARLAAATPGEWRATHGAAVWARQSDCDLEVADCWSPAIRDERCQANADLIANAPAYLRELMALAKAARAHYYCKICEGSGMAPLLYGDPDNPEVGYEECTCRTELVEALAPLLKEVES